MISPTHPTAPAAQDLGSLRKPASRGSFFSWADHRYQYYITCTNRYQPYLRILASPPKRIEKVGIMDTERHLKWIDMEGPKGLEKIHAWMFSPDMTPRRFGYLANSRLLYRQVPEGIRVIAMDVPRVVEGAGGPHFPRAGGRRGRASRCYSTPRVLGKELCAVSLFLLSGVQLCQTSVLEMELQELEESKIEQLQQTRLRFVEKMEELNSVCDL